MFKLSQVSQKGNRVEVNERGGEPNIRGNKSLKHTRRKPKPRRESSAHRTQPLLQRTPSSLPFLFGSLSLNSLISTQIHVIQSR
ncbi:hypothetical protein L3X38_014866 [Prunus dulcis]|uniref:Uncharacterized protein n=1 Tax=Prunus dulcis TaxID=3755 RepID=A0AAD4ZHH8_PRUDU|nr:hypothetical protein L3X38_014866 [Prunus dulcis]